MNKPARFDTDTGANERGNSLLERADALYDFQAFLRGGDTPAPAEDKPSEPSGVDAAEAPPIETSANEAVRIEQSSEADDQVEPELAVVPRHSSARGHALAIDRDLLADHSLIVPDGPVNAINEEFRIVKRQLLIAAMGNRHQARIDKGERILVTSAHPNEGKTYSALNLALSIAAEQDHEVLLVDADFGKPSVLSSLGIEQDNGRKGLMDALSNASVAVEDCVLGTDIPGLFLLPAGCRTNTDTEYLASARTEKVLDSLTRNNSGRIVIFDSPPALAASPASELAHHVGQVVLVVKADRTTESSLQDALGLLAGCDEIQLLLNSVKFSPTGRSFGSYYGYGD